MNAFKAYDIRGVWGTDLTEEIVYSIGNLIPSVLNSKKVLVGRDIRLSSDTIFNSLVSGLIDAGADVVDAGLTTTPMVYWASGKYSFTASVMITASHNAKEYNGLKVSGKDVLPIGYANGLSKIESLIEEGQKYINPNKGKLTSIHIKDEYLRFLEQYRSGISSLKIAIDCSNGMAGLLVRDLFGNDINYINEKPDGIFPGHDPNPLNPKNQEQIKGEVTKSKSDIGLIFDGDADRVMFIDENGSFISPDMIIGLLGYFFFPEKSDDRVVLQDIRTSKAVGEFLQQFGVEVATWKVGRAFAAPRLKELNGVYGGELAGHYYFKDFYFSDSAMVAALIVVGIVSRFKKEGTTLSQLISKISSYANTGEINFKLDRKQEAMDAVRDFFVENEPPVKFYDFDGYRLEFEDWWFNIRPSNTEPYLRFLAEAKTEKLLNEKTKVIFDLVNSHA